MEGNDGRARCILTPGEPGELKELQVSLERWGTGQVTGVYLTSFEEQRANPSKNTQTDVCWTASYTS